MAQVTSPRHVNRALAAAGLKVEIVRGDGYYYFQDETTAIRSICSWPRLYQTPESIVQYVRDELARIAS